MLQAHDFDTYTKHNILKFSIGATYSIGTFISQKWYSHDLGWILGVDFARLEYKQKK